MEYNLPLPPHSLNCLLQESSILVVGEQATFFTLYSVFQQAGLSVCHFDRDEKVLKGAAGRAGELVAAVDRACQQARCVLVSS
jgi:hypothetical protein